MSFQKTLIAASVFALLSACSSDNLSEQNTTPLNSQTEVSNQEEAVVMGKVNVLVTNSLLSQFAEAWVSILEIEVKDANGNSFTVFENVDGQIINLTELTGVAQLLGTPSLPEGEYSSFEITLSPEVTVIDVNGDSQILNLSSNREKAELTLTGSLTVLADEVVSFALDFDVSQFVVDDIGNLELALTANSEVEDLETVTVDASGTVTEVNNDILIVTPNSDHAPIVVNLNDVVVVGDSVEITEGDEVEVEGSFDLETQTANVSRVDIESDDETLAESVELEGTIISVGVNEIILDVQEADFMPPANTMSVLLSGNPAFIRGSEQALAIGQRIEVNGQMLGGLLSAKNIEIESDLDVDDLGDDDSGAGVRNGNAANNISVQGTVVSVDNGVLVLSVTQSNNAAMALNSSIAVDLSAIPGQNIDAQCLVLGNIVEVKGALDSINNFIPSRVISDLCASNLDDDIEENEVDLTGEVLSINDNGVMEVQLHQDLSEQLVFNILNVDLNTIQLDSDERDEDHSMLTVGSLVEIEAIINENEIIVVEIEALDSDENESEIDEVEGTVISIDNDVVVMTVNKFDKRTGMSNTGREFSFAMPNFTNSTNGQIALSVGDMLEVKGHFDGTSFNVQDVEIESPDIESDSSLTP